MSGAAVDILAKGVPPMRPPVWELPVALSPVEHTIVKRIKRAKLFVFLRQHRHTLFDPTVQTEKRADA